MQNKFQIIALALVPAIVAGAMLFTATQVQAQPGAQTSTAADDYCTQQGGTVVQRTPTYNTNAAQSAWLSLANPRNFCTFLAPPDSTGFQSQISIDVDTLYADQPTLAVLAYLEPIALPPFTGANPSTLYCQSLGGTDIWGGENNAAGGGWVTQAPDSATNNQVVGMCVFPDMSSIDSWGLTYKANGVIRGTDLSKVVRYKPATVPSVFVSGSSASLPAESTVDKTLTSSDNGSSATINVGDTLTVNLGSNPSTGYSWKIAENDPKVLVPVGSSQFSLGPNTTPMPGAGGTQTFNFKGMSAGKSTLTLVYVRPWEKDTTPTPQNTWTVTVTVQ